MNDILKDVNSKKSVQKMINDVQNTIDGLKEEIAEEAKPDKNSNNDDK